MSGRVEADGAESSRMVLLHGSRRAMDIFSIMSYRKHAFGEEGLRFSQNRS